MNNTIYKEIAAKIIQRQEQIIGPVAWQLAARVKNLNILDTDRAIIEITNEPKIAIDELVAQYEYLFGKLGILECRDTATSLLSNLKPEDMPECFK